MRMMRSFGTGKIMLGIGLTAATAAMVAMAPTIKNMAVNMKSDSNKVLTDETYDHNTMK
ncbi:MAG: hypothetical protein ACERLG_04225 [Sedimentibacter sp.]